MKVVQINAISGVGSTGKICTHISDELTKRQIENYILYCSGYDENPVAIKYGTSVEVKVSALLSRVMGNYGFNSLLMTRKLIKLLEKINPNIIHLHNLHGHNCNLEMLFRYISKKNIKVLWTFHDCWAFTAYCPHFTYVKCEKWKKECEYCSEFKKYSWFLDKSKKNFKRKKITLENTDFVIVTPSIWLADLVKQSFLKKYEVKIINNGIDLDVFKPTQNKVREKYNISEEKKILLGVAYGWGIKKGLDIFEELATRLDSTKYQIILVGTNKKDDKELSGNIISINRTQNQAELAELYTAADVFVNPTREEVLGLVNIEALACGTPVVTYRTGGCTEVVSKEVGAVVECNDIDLLEKEIVRICKNKTFLKERCIERAKKFDMNDRYMEYIDLYKELLC